LQLPWCSAKGFKHGCYVLGGYTVECSAIPPFALATARAEVDLLDTSSGLKPLYGFPRKACFEQITL
jgi:hypothetical protein